MRMHTTASIGDDELLEVGTAFQVEVLARRYYQLFNERRLDEAERLVDPQAVFTYPVAGEHLIGRAGYRELARRWIGAFPDVRVRVVHVHVSEATVVRAHLHAEGTHRGSLELPGVPPIAPTGRHAQLSLTETSTISNLLIVGSRLEFDLDALRKVLGL
jgi:predicted ester cyclase